MNEVLKVIKTRRSVRKFMPDQIKEEELQAILEAGRYAPTAMNEQPWFFTVIQNKEILADINKRSKEGMLNSGVEFMVKMAKAENFDIHYNAPTVIVISGKADFDFTETDCSAATQNMLVAAKSLGISSCWIGLSKFCIQNPEYFHKLNIPAGYKPLYTIILGYPENPKESEGPKRKEDVVSYIR